MATRNLRISADLFLDLAATRHDQLVSDVLKVVGLFPDLDTLRHVEALFAAEMLIPVQNRPLSEIVVGVLDRTELTEEQKRAVLAEARKILTGEMVVELTPQGDAARLVEIAESPNA